MLERLLHRRPLVGVEGEHLLEQVQGLGVRVGVDPAEGDLGLVGEGGQVTAGLQ